MTTVSWSILHAQSARAQTQTELPQVTVEVPRVVHANAPRRNVKPKRRPVVAVTRPAAPESAAGSVAQPNGPPVTMTTAGPVSGYQALTATTSTKTATPIEHIPQSIVVLPRSIIDDQYPVAQNDILHNVSSVSGMTENSVSGFYYKVRGFMAERYVDGLPNYNDGGDFTSTVNTERIEVIKGPGGLFYQGGLGVVGGVINTISKLPMTSPQYQTGLNIGSFGLYNPWFDINQPLDSTGGVLFRMTGEYATSRDYVDVIQRERFSLNPTLAFDDHDGTRLIIQGSMSRRQGQIYAGLPGTGTVDTSAFSIRPNFFFGDPGGPIGVSDYDGATVRFTRELNSMWTFNVASRYETSRLDAPSQSFLLNTPDFPPSSFLFANSHIFDASTDFSIAPNLVGKFDTGPTRNTVVFGADYDRAATNVFGWESFPAITDLASPNPIAPPFVDPVGPGLNVFTDRAHLTNAGLIGQWQSTIFDRLHILAGVREAYLENQLVNFLPGTLSYDAAHTKALPRFGAAFDILTGVSVFAGYSEGLRGERYFNGTTAPKAEESQQIESGLKLKLPSGFAATLAVFDISYTNVATASTASPFLQIQAGRERSRGFDADLTWQPVAGLSILANYAHVDARLVADNIFPVGNFVDFVPMDSGRLWANYKFQSGWLENFAIGGGLYSATRQTLDLTNQFWTPGYTIFDGKIAYEAKDWTLALSGKNLTNRHYFVPFSFFTLGRVAPGTPLSVLASLTVRH